MVRGEQGVPGKPAPCRKISRRARVQGDEAQHRARRQRFHAKPQLQHEIAAAEVAGIPCRIGDLWLTHGALASGVARA